MYHDEILCDQLIACEHSAKYLLHANQDSKLYTTCENCAKRTPHARTMQNVYHIENHDRHRQIHTFIIVGV